MADPRLAWLEKCAEKLVAHQETQGAISVRTTLNLLGLSLEKRCDPAARRSYGIVERRDNEHIRVIVVRQDAEKAPLSHRERFTIAHEIGHVLLKEKFNWNPFSGKDYYLCEEYCDYFAGLLLLPISVFSGVQIDNPHDCVRAVLNLSERMKVSKEVVARRLIEQFDNVAVGVGNLSMNAKKERVVRFFWACSSLTSARWARNKHLSSRDFLGPTLLKNWSHFRKTGGDSIGVDRTVVHGSPLPGSRACMISALQDKCLKKNTAR
jgi:hypothetical protein